MAKAAECRVIAVLYYSLVVQFCHKHTADCIASYCGRALSLSIVHTHRSNIQYLLLFTLLADQYHCASRVITVQYRPSRTSNSQHAFMSPGGVADLIDWRCAQEEDSLDFRVVEQRTCCTLFVANCVKLHAALTAPESS